MVLSQEDKTYLRNSFFCVMSSTFILVSCLIGGIVAILWYSSILIPPKYKTAMETNLIITNNSLTDNKVVCTISDTIDQISSCENITLDHNNPVCHTKICSIEIPINCSSCKTICVISTLVNTCTENLDELNCIREIKQNETIYRCGNIKLPFECENSNFTCYNYDFNCDCATVCLLYENQICNYQTINSGIYEITITKLAVINNASYITNTTNFNCSNIVDCENMIKSNDKLNKVYYKPNTEPYEFKYTAEKPVNTTAITLIILGLIILISGCAVGINAERKKCSEIMVLSQNDDKDRQEREHMKLCQRNS